MYKHDIQTHNMTAPRLMMPHIIQMFEPMSILDVGCGLATWIAAAKELGVADVIGVDGAYVDRELLQIPLQQFQPVDLALPFDLERRFDMAISLEVAEHLSEESADNFIASICAHTDIVVFSAAIPGQGGQNHINCQWPDYWEQKFFIHNFMAHDVLREKFWEVEEIEWWYRQNMMIFARKGSIKLPIKSPRRIVHPNMLKEKVKQIERLTAKIARNNGA